MNNLNVNEEALSKKLEAIAKRPKGQSAEQAALEVTPTLSNEERAVMVALGTDALLQRARILKQPHGDIQHG